MSQLFFFLFFSVWCIGDGPIHSHTSPIPSSRLSRWLLSRHSRSHRWHRSKRLLAQVLWGRIRQSTPTWLKRKKETVQCSDQTVYYINFVIARVEHNSLTTDKTMALVFLLEIEFRILSFCERKKPGEPEKNARSQDENRKQTQLTWWKASALSTAPPMLLQLFVNKDRKCRTSRQTI